VLEIYAESICFMQNPKQWYPRSCVGKCMSHYLVNGPVPHSYRWTRRLLKMLGHTFSLYVARVGTADFSDVLVLCFAGCKVYVVLCRLQSVCCAFQVAKCMLCFAGCKVYVNCKLHTTQ
jgi:hypothetical protein